MKKLIMILIMGILMIGIIPAEVIQIETSRGTQDFVKPDDMTDDEIIYMLASMYLEERYANDDLVDIRKQFDELSSSVEEYMAENELLKQKNHELMASYDKALLDYEKLAEDQDALVIHYEEMLKPTFIRGMLGAGAIIDDKGTLGMRLSGGIIFMENIAIELGVNLLPPVFSLEVTYLF